jgi:hypothetical protein
MSTNKSAIPGNRRRPRSRPADHRHAGRAAGPEHCARGVRSLSRTHALRRLGATHATLTYRATDNHDPEDDSKGTDITVSRP